MFFVTAHHLITNHTKQQQKCRNSRRKFDFCRKIRPTKMHCAKLYLPAMEQRCNASQNTCTKYSLLTGLCSGVCVAEFVVITVWYELFRWSSSSEKKPTAIFAVCVCVCGCTYFKLRFFFSVRVLGCDARKHGNKKNIRSIGNEKCKLSVCFSLFFSTCCDKLWQMKTVQVQVKFALNWSIFYGIFSCIHFVWPLSLQLFVCVISGTRFIGFSV